MPDGTLLSRILGPSRAPRNRIRRPRVVPARAPRYRPLLTTAIWLQTRPAQYRSPEKRRSLVERTPRECHSGQRQVALRDWTPWVARTVTGDRNEAQFPGSFALRRPARAITGPAQGFAGEFRAPTARNLASPEREASKFRMQKTKEICMYCNQIIRLLRARSEAALHVTCAKLVPTSEYGCPVRENIFPPKLAVGGTAACADPTTKSAYL